MLRRTRVSVSWTVLAAVLLAPLGTGAQTAPPTAGEPWEAEVKALLERRAAAVEAGDEAAFTATMAAAPEQFRREKQTWFQRIRTLPIGVYRLEFTQDEFSELTRQRDRQRYRGEVHVVQVKERIGLRGYDVTSSWEDLFLTVVKADEGWSVVADNGLETIGLQSNRNIWDFGPIARLEADGLMVVSHPAEREAAPRILAAARSARDFARRAWPLAWREDTIAIMIPSTVEELERIFQTTFDLSTFVAFAASSVDRSAGWNLTGGRVFLQWPNFRRYSSSLQQTFLRHEFTHIATRELSGPFIRSFMDEGVAQLYGEGASNPPTPELRARVRAKRFTERLPPDWFFVTGPPSDIFFSYEAAADFAAYLAGRFGKDAAARLYNAVGSENHIAAGTWRYHLDRACRALFGVAYATLEGDWARAVVKELA